MRRAPRTSRSHALSSRAIPLPGTSPTSPGGLTAHPPWWSFLWFAAHGLGWWVTVASVVCCAAAVVLRHDRLVAWCAAALVGPLVFHMFIAGVMLPYYWVDQGSHSGWHGVPAWPGDRDGLVAAEIVRQAIAEVAGQLGVPELHRWATPVASSRDRKCQVGNDRDATAASCVEQPAVAEPTTEGHVPDDAEQVCQN